MYKYAVVQIVSSPALAGWIQTAGLAGKAKYFTPGAACIIFGLNVLTA
jgi:hypothetical protein